MIDPCSFDLRPRSGTQLLRLVAAGGALAGALSAACGSSDRTSAAAKSPSPSRVETLEHEPCSELGKRVELLDTNNDGKADIRRMFDPTSGREVCRVVDLNRDGKEDLFEYFDTAGTIRRREYCYDDSAAVNAVELYQGGQLARREYDTTGRHKIDTWDWFDGSAPVDPKTGRPAHPARRERDTTGDGTIDQWWTWQGDKVTIATDRNADGKPDPDSTIVLGADDAGPSSPAAPVGVGAAAADAGAPTTNATGSAPAGEDAASSATQVDGGKS